MADKKITDLTELTSGNTADADLLEIVDNDADESKKVRVDSLLAHSHDHTESQISDLNHTDSDALHDNVGGEINAIAAKTTLVGADITIIEDSEDSSLAKKKATIANVLATQHDHTESDITDLDHTDADAIHDNVGGEINAITTKASPVAADILMIEDSEDSSLIKKKITLLDILALLNSSYFNGYLAAQAPGFRIRSSFGYVDEDTISISPGVYHHQGTVEQLVYWDEVINFTLGNESNASNDDNSALSGADWYYLYIDDSAVVSLGDNELTASEFVAVTTEPEWSDSKHGWYNGDNRCIMAFKTNSGNLIEFYHDGGDLISFGTTISLLYQVDYKTTWIDADLSAGLPSFSKMARCTSYPNGGSSFYYRPNGSSEANGISLGWIWQANVLILTDNSQLAEFKSSASDTDWITLAGSGFFLPQAI